MKKKCIGTGKLHLKRLCPAEFISASLMPVSIRQVRNRQVAYLAGVNILWDAEINSAGLPFFDFHYCHEID